METGSAMVVFRLCRSIVDGWWVFDSGLLPFTVSSFQVCLQLNSPGWQRVANLAKVGWILDGFGISRLAEQWEPLVARLMDRFCSQQ